MADCVRVVVRVRPLNEPELTRRDSKAVRSVDQNTLEVTNDD